MKHKYQIAFGGAIALILSMVSGSALALDVKITQDIEAITVHHGDEFVTIKRVQDQSNVLTGGFTKTSRKCPPFCIQPLKVAPGVDTVGELELLDFIEKKLEMQGLNSTQMEEFIKAYLSEKGQKIFLLRRSG